MIRKILQKPRSKKFRNDIKKTRRDACLFDYLLFPSNGVIVSVVGSTSVRQRTLIAIISLPSGPLPRQKE